MKRITSTLALALLLACGTESASGANGSTSFPSEGPYPTFRMDTDALVYFFPDALESESNWPSLIWFNGLSGYTEDFNYNGLLESVASWGFIVVGGKSSGMNDDESDQLSDLLRRNADPADAMFGRVDEERIAVAGHSFGGFQTTEVSNQYRVAAAVQGAGTPTMSEAAPTFFMTSEGDEVVEDATVINAFEQAINEAWLANHASADHNDPRGDGGVYREPIIAFLRWQLRDDANGARWFNGDDCLLCTDSSWSFDSQ